MTPDIGFARGKFEPDQTGPVSAENIRAQVQLIIHSEGFARSERLKRFLGFTVEETLAGRGQQLKAYTIAVGVCDRDQRFDSRLDPIVRIEAGRLRRALQHYYLTTGCTDLVLIDMPKGGYHPVFFRRETAPARPTTTPALAEHRVAHWRAHADAIGDRLRTTWRNPDRAMVLRLATFAVALAVLGGAWYLFDDSRSPHRRAATGTTQAQPPAEKIALIRGPAIILLPFDGLGGESGQDRFAQGLTDDLARYLSSLADVSVYPANIGLPIDSQQESRGAGRPGEAAFVVRGSVRRAAEKVRVLVQLIDAQSGAGLWAQTVDSIVNFENSVEMQDQIARAFVTKLVGTNGAVTNTMLARFYSSSDTRSFGTYECTLRQYIFMRTWHAKDHDALRSCLERTIIDHPDLSRSWSALSYVYLNEYRYGYGNDPGDTGTLERAQIAARRAVDLDRMDVRSREALSIALYYGKGFARSFAMSEALAEQFPADPALSARVAARLAFAGVGLWNEGMERFYAAKARTIDPPGWFFLITSLDEYRRGDDRAALREADQIDMAGFIMRPMIYAMIYGQLGMQTEAKAALAEARKINPAFVDAPRKWFMRLTFDQVLFARMMDGLEKVGLDVHDGSERPAVAQ